VMMRLKDTGLPLHSDATFKVRPRLFLEGNYFVDVSPGSPGRPLLAEDGLVPASQTKALVSVGQVLSVLQRDTREDLRSVLQELGTGLRKGGRGYNRSLPFQAPAFKYSAIVNEATLGEDPDGRALSRYVASAGVVADGLNRDPAALKGLVSDFATTAGAFASEQRNLGAAIDELPRTLRIGRTALGSLNRAFPPLRRFVAAYRPAVRTSGPALDAQLPLVRQLRRLVGRPELQGLVTALRPVVPDLVELNRDGIELQEEQRLLASCQTEVVQPWQNDSIPDGIIPAKGKVFQEGVRWLPGIAGESRSFDANGQYIKTTADGANFATATGDGRFFLTGSPLQGVQPQKARKDPPLRPDVPCETQEKPNLAGGVQAPPPAQRVRQDAPGAAARLAAAQGRATDWLREQLGREGLADTLDVSDTPLTAAAIPELERAR
jgi:phospholipid/cholesterol/gamma-HCH transport system substrate-binding protein